MSNTGFQFQRQRESRLPSAHRQCSPEGVSFLFFDDVQRVFENLPPTLLQVCDMAADEIDKKRRTTAAHHPTRQTANKTGINGNKNNADNTNNVIESFHVMDQEKMGEITAQQCYTLVLGLGIDVPRADLNALLLQYNDQNLNHITLHVVLKLLKQVSKMSVFCSLGGV